MVSNLKYEINPNASMTAQVLEIGTGCPPPASYIRFSKPLGQEVHQGVLLGAAGSFEGMSLEPKLGGEIKVPMKDVTVVQDYKGYMLKPDLIGTVIGTITVEGRGKSNSHQTVYLYPLNQFNRRNDDVLDYFKGAYAKRGGAVYPRINFTAEEIAAGFLNTKPEEISEGMDIALDIGSLVRDGLQERWTTDGIKVLVQTYWAPQEALESAACFAAFVGRDLTPKNVLPLHIIKPR